MFPQFLLGLLVLVRCGKASPLNISSEEPTGLLMAGGGSWATNPTAVVSAEVFIPSSGKSCLIAGLPDSRLSHTMDGGYLCGGLWDVEPEVMKTCLKYSAEEDQWSQKPSYTFKEKRSGHSSWISSRGLHLMGGWFSGTTSEIVPIDGGKGGTAFDMKYKTKWACSIPDMKSQTVILIGGWKETNKKVSRYNKHGHVEDLAELTEGRFDAGCGAYLRGDGTQVMLVAGGSNLDGIFISSTEILVGNSHSWKTVTPLPILTAGRTGLGAINGATLGNILYMTGGYDGRGEHTEIFQWKDDTEEWMEVGKMIKRRSSHSMTTIKIQGGMIDNC